MTQAIILCAGAGTRLGNLTKETPKPMVRFNEKPFLQYVLNFYKEQNIIDIIIPVGYFGDQIKLFFKDGSDFGLSVQYAESSVDVETGGSFKRSLSKIKDAFFFVQYGDIFFPLDYQKLLSELISSGKKGIISVCKREGILDYEDKDDLLVENGLVKLYDRGNKSRKCNYLNGGVMIFRKDVINYDYPDKFRLEEFLFPKLIESEDLIAYITTEVPYDIGNQDKMKRFKEYLVMKK